MNTRTTRLTLTATSAMLLAPFARAELLWGASTNGLVSFDSVRPWTPLSMVAVSGLPSGFTISAIDFRPSNGRLYAFCASSSTTERLYTIDTGTGAATLVGNMGVNVLSPFGGMAFDPLTGQIRIIDGGGGANYRFNPDTGVRIATDTTVAYVAGDPSIAFGTADIEGVAYGIPVAGLTTLYAVRRDSNPAEVGLIRVGDAGGSPNSADTGRLTTIGPLGLTTAPATWGFDISPATGIAYAVDGKSPGSNLYSINLVTGAATPLGTSLGGLFSIAVAPTPEPTSGLLLAGSGIALLLRRRRGA